MARVFVDLIKKGAICPKTGEPYTLDDVPKRLRKEVEELLKDDN